MNTQEYDKIQAIRATQVKALATGGPRSLWEMTYGEENTTPSIQFGSMTHLRALQPEQWKNNILVENIDRRTKEGKARAIEVEASGKTVVKPEEAEKIEKISLEWIKTADEILGKDYQTEQVFASKIGGVDIKAQIDALSKDMKTIVDLKTISDIGQAEREIWKRRYDLQLGHYANCITGSTTDKTFNAYLIFVETSSPYRCKAVDLTNILSRARIVAANFATQAFKCLETYGEDLNAWPQPKTSVITEYPEWISNTDDIEN